MCCRYTTGQWLLACFTRAGGRRVSFDEAGLTRHGTTNLSRSASPARCRTKDDGRGGGRAGPDRELDLAGRGGGKPSWGTADRAARSKTHDRASPRPPTHGWARRPSRSAPNGRSIRREGGRINPRERG